MTIVDRSAHPKAMQIYFPATSTLTQLQTFVTNFAPLVNAVIDGVIASSLISVQATLPGGLRSVAVDGNRVNEGALLTFDADSTNYAHSIYIPSWANSEFNGGVINETQAITDLLDALVQGVLVNSTRVDPMPSDKYANDLVAFVKGVRAFRK